ncbi:NAD(P)H-hydrate dehydratase [[Eubacterium] cellulosolvens]
MIEYYEIGVLDRNALYYGVPTIDLMENAGAGVANVVQERLDVTNKLVILICGLGNNGGDGLVAARHLATNTTGMIRVVLLGPPQEIKSIIATENFYRLPKNVEIITLDKPGDRAIKDLNLAEAAVVIDAMLGVGITGTLKKPYSTIVNLLNSLPRNSQPVKGKRIKTKASRGKAPGSLVLAVDVPTGLGTKTALKPEITVTFHDSKTGMTAQNSGEIIIHDIGIPQEAETYVGPGDLTLIPRLIKDGHKGDHGRLLVIGGGPYTGAPALVGLSAYRTGVDLVHIATPNTIANIIAGFSPNFIVHPLENNTRHLTNSDIKTILGLIKSTEADAIVMGPGLGRNNETLEAVNEIIKKAPKSLPMLLDADAFTALAAETKPGLITLLKDHWGVLTPHRGEFNKLLGSTKFRAKKTRKKQTGRSVFGAGNDTEFDALQESVKQFTHKLGGSWTVLLKGQIDVITDGNSIKLNRTGNPGMTVGGTGDMLAGITGGLLARGLAPFHAARAAAFINGYSGDLAWNRFRNGLVATDILDFIPQCIKDSLDE